MKCPYCGDEVENSKYVEHLQTCPEVRRQSKDNPTLKQLFTGSTLNGYVEAAKTKTLNQFQTKPFTFLLDEGMPTEDVISVDAANEFEAAIKARDEFTKRHKTYHKTSKIVDRQVAIDQSFGYRVGEPQETRAVDVIEFEVVALGNHHIAKDVCKALGGKDCEVGDDPAPIMDYIKTLIEKRFGVDAIAMWLCDSPTWAEKRYGPGESYKVMVPKEAILGSDLGTDGKLWIWKRPSR